MERHGHILLDAVLKDKLLSMSAATIDRALRATREKIDGQRRRRTGIGSAIRRSIPVRTFADWGDPPPGFLEVDMVEHCGGPKTDGNYVHTLVLTDIASGWTECVAMPVRNQLLIVEGMIKVCDSAESLATGGANVRGVADETRDPFELGYESSCKDG